jgi:integrase
MRGTRDRIASPVEATKLLGVLRPADQALWGTALYAGLRRGELMALKWKDVDLATGRIRIERSYDPGSGQMVEPKSRAGRRTVPIPGVLRDLLIDHKLNSGDTSELVFGATPERPFSDSALVQRARRAWARSGLDPLGLHEARHTFASLMIAAGVNAKALSTYMGHSSITITLDRYGHLMPGNEDEAAALMDTYLEAAQGTNVSSAA